MLVYSVFLLLGCTAFVAKIGSFDRHAHRVIIDNHILPFVYYIYDSSAGPSLQEDNFGPSMAKNIASYMANVEKRCRS